MRTQNIINFFLLLLLIGLASFVFLSDKKDNKLDLLSQINRNEVNQITINYNHKVIKLFKNITTNQNESNKANTANNWQITQPIAIAANNIRVNTLLGLLKAPYHHKYSSQNIDLKKLGFEQQNTQISFNQLTISFGITNPATHLRYVKINDFIYTIEDAYSPLLQSSFVSLIALKLLKPTQVMTKIKTHKLNFFQNKNNLWQSNNASIPADNIIKMVNTWTHAQAFGVHDYLPRKNLGFADIYLSGSHAPIHFEVTETQSWLILARVELGIEYHLSKENYQQLFIQQ